MKRKNILRKALSVFMTLIMAFSVMAVGVYAEDPVCTCTAKCTTEENKNTECPICSVDYSACEYIPTSGNCGAVGNEGNVIWNFNTATGTLTISGTGAMADYTYDLDGEDQPWVNYRGDITKIVIGYGVTEIGVLAFYDCRNAEEVVFERNENGESSVVSIGKNTFNNCFSLTEIEIPASVETIGDSAFRNCNSLTSLVFEEGSSLGTIGKYSFYNLKNSEECIIPSKVTSIGNHAFRSNPPLKRFYYPADTSFGYYVFYDDSLLEYFGKYTVNENDNTCSIKYIGVTAAGSDYTPDENAEITASEIVIPEKIDGYKVVSATIGEEVIDTTAINSLPENIVVENSVNKLSDVTALNGWEYEAETDEIPAGGSVQVTVKKAINETQNITRIITVSRKAATSSGSSGSSKPSQPTVKGSDKTGWEGVIDAADNAKDGEKITVNMNANTELPKTVLDEIKGRDVTIVLNMGNGIEWIINGKDVETPKNVNFGVSYTTTQIPIEVVNNITGETEIKQISIAHNGEFGFKATMSIALGEKNNGLTANLMYYNPETKALDFTDSAVIANGRADLEFTHASVWAIVIDDHSFGDAMNDLAAGESTTVTEILL